MNVFVANEQELPVDEVTMSALARHVLQSEEIEGDAELSVLLVTADHIKHLNSRFAGEDHATDVLAFPMMEDDDNVLLLGDVVICPRVAESNAAKAGHELNRELQLLVVHGTLHLLGYDHDVPDAKERMEARQEEILGSFPANRPA